MRRGRASHATDQTHAYRHCKLCQSPPETHKFKVQNQQNQTDRYQKKVCLTIVIPHLVFVFLEANGKESDCGSAIPVGVLEYASCARVYSFSLPGSRRIIACLVAPVKPLFKTEGEVAAMDFVLGKCHNNIVILWSLVLRIFQTGRTSLPVPKVFAYCSEANPVGAEWVLMEYMPGVELCKAWEALAYDKRARFALDLVDTCDQLSQLRAHCCGVVYHSTRRSTDDLSLPASLSQTIRSPRWKPLSSSSIRFLRAHYSFMT